MFGYRSYECSVVGMADSVKLSSKSLGQLYAVSAREAPPQQGNDASDNDWGSEECEGSESSDEDAAETDAVVGPQITLVDLLFTCNYICKCKVNVNVPKCLPFTLRLRGLLFAFDLITCNCIFGCNLCFLVGFWGDLFLNSPPPESLTHSRPHKFFADPTNFLTSTHHQCPVPHRL
jgi:hypothetical protein